MSFKYPKSLDCGLISSDDVVSFGGENKDCVEDNSPNNVAKSDSPDDSDDCIAKDDASDDILGGCIARDDDAPVDVPGGCIARDDDAPVDVDACVV